MKLTTILTHVAVAGAITVLTPQIHLANNGKITSAWQSLQTKNFKTSQKIFSEILDAEPNNQQAFTGLMYMHLLNRDVASARTLALQFLQKSENPNPFLVAMGYSLFIGDVTETGLSSAENFCLKVLENPKVNGSVRTYASYALGKLYLERGEIDKGQQYYNQYQSVENWSVIGEFDNVSASGFDKVFPPENEIRFGVTYQGINNTPCSWFVPPAIRRDKWLDFTNYFVANQAVYYAVSYVYSPKKQATFLRVGTSGACKVWLNDELTITEEDEFNNDADTYAAHTELQQGWNKLLVKIAAWEIRKSNFLVRLTDENGVSLPDLESSAIAKEYTSKPNAPVRKVPFFAEEYYKSEIQKSPQSLENYILLADVYLHNDKGELAEITLRDALKISPNNVLILDKMLDAYIRNRKPDQVTSTFEKLSSLNAETFNALEYRFNKLLEVKDIDAAEKVLDSLKQLGYKEEQYLASQMQIKAARRDPNLSDFILSSYEKYPLNPALVRVYVAFTNAGLKRKDLAIRALQKLLKAHYTEGNLEQLANIYINNGTIGEVEKIHDEILRLNPTSYGYLYYLSNFYIQENRLDRAISYLQTAQKLYPFAARSYDMRGDIAMKQGQKDTALSYYQKALSYSPFSTFIREKINQQLGKPALFTNFPALNIDSLRATAPKPSDYPESEYAIVLEERRVVIHPNAGWSRQEEFLYKIFTKDGVDRLKEYSLGNLDDDDQVEKAVTIKPDGTEIPADINGGNIVFKSLEVGDFAYVKYRTHHSAGGMMQKQFVDVVYFDGLVPEKFGRYTVFAPKGMKLPSVQFNLPNQPVTKETEDGTFYTWTVENLAPIEIEASTANIDEMRKFVEISTIPDWNYVVRWYKELSHKRAKPTYEIRELMTELIGTPSERVKLSDEEVMRRVYEYITENIRYSFVPFRQSGLIPQDARDVLITRIGDCKDVATLGMAMLSVAGIQSDYVLVNSGVQTERAYMPTTYFNHCILRVHTTSGIKYLDLTANSFSVGSIPPPDLDCLTLPIADNVNDALRLRKESFVPTTEKYKLKSTFDNNRTMTVERETTLSGSLAAQIRRIFREKSSKDREKMYTESLGKLYPNVKLTTLSFPSLDTLTPTVTYSMKYTVPKHISETGRFKMFAIPWVRTLELDEALSYDERKYPLDCSLGYDTSYQEIEIELPKGYAPVDLPPSVTKSCSAADYKVAYSYKNGILRCTRMYIIKNERVEVANYHAFKEFFNDVIKEDERQLLLDEEALIQSKPAPKAKGKR